MSPLVLSSRLRRMCGASESWTVIEFQAVYHSFAALEIDSLQSVVAVKNIGVETTIPAQFRENLKKVAPWAILDKRRVCLRVVWPPAFSDRHAPGLAYCNPMGRQHRGD